jgi:c-di-GMP-binding flagellar brake protein YcgR
MYKGQERRRYKRIEKPYRGRFKIRSDEAQEMEAYDWDSVTLHDLSAGGTAFFCNKGLGIGTLLHLKIDVYKSTLTMNCLGKIIRIEQPQPNSMFRIAAEFTEIDEQEKAMINTTFEKALE